MGIFDIGSYNYNLPPELIAQAPAASRDASRLLVACRAEGRLSERRFYDLPKLLTPGDVLVINDTRVMAARLSGRKESGGSVELLVLGSSDGSRCAERDCLMKSSKPPRKGLKISFEGGLSGCVDRVIGDGMVRISFFSNSPLEDVLERIGRVPLPPYIKRDGEKSADIDRERYQTVYARVPGAVAAPTAGLHFTDALIERLAERGIEVCPITLHVGYGTFQPVRVEDIRKHCLHSERYCISDGSAERIRTAKARGGRVIAVGTTAVRALESSAIETGEIRSGDAETDLLIIPGFGFSVVDGLITNFHLPRSSLMFLVSAFAGLQFIKDAYNYAVLNRFRFFSYGDAMLIL
ncbi:MAG: tRNA preQ1(34) S-adenosylmethionine ribosyltransferase-isomerase QueA [Deltaproteobacteria bacterium CG_4_8_14_3_um_filter_51_11]|nr:tRNA preQ1(34) S-adenosylmethionine ribosyltransferase-isomerase QueA [bacterium]OIP41084.1 MAG: tRNA preQ1(34) S-adenosylmethionine ribosyltransferase-isomerase QueA [Desulfobacteraceae bacterium CG2_30_51_40]PIP45167.1 MAG: tRNA preQ1(34) S-adenosylmethionine ribosyltransferase-isomerase QueA [Deltaproteobacteria bacterium CG23_combo_of_CG06-09_8_20_14_all_51_20]PIV99765.1 MAG: tRNA preQ1(34) S-adenosylmethionine ribosyltransferase-isomerase QueA [Deltaproteobacteria bacterium CG17_big_fil_